MSEASDLKQDIASLEDEALQKRFAALFDDGQGENARREFVRYCKLRQYHPSEMYILCGKNLLRRHRDMLKRLEKLNDEYRAANKYLFDEVYRLSGNRVELPPLPITERATNFQRLIRRKFGTSAAARQTACQTLRINGRQFSRLAKGGDVTDGLIERIEELPDYLHRSLKSKKVSKKIFNRDYEEFERKFSYIPKPKKNDREKSSMTPDDLRQNVASWPLGDNWIELFARLTQYDPWNFQQFMKGGDNRKITKDTERFIRQVNQALQDSGGTARVG